MRPLAFAIFDTHPRFGRVWCVRIQDLRGTHDLCVCLSQGKAELLASCVNAMVGIKVAMQEATGLFDVLTPKEE